MKYIMHTIQTLEYISRNILKCQKMTKYKLIFYSRRCKKFKMRFLEVFGPFMQGEDTAKVVWKLGPTRHLKNCKIATGNSLAR